jgi:hypothetical protein
LRLVPPEGGILKECLRRHGIVTLWSDLPALVPELCPEPAVAAIKDAESDIAAELEALSSASYRVPGRRGRPPVAMWDASRVNDPAGLLSRLLGVDIELPDVPSPPEPDPPSKGAKQPASMGQTPYEEEARPIADEPAEPNAKTEPCGLCVTLDADPAGFRRAFP